MSLGVLYQCLQKGGATSFNASKALEDITGALVEVAVVETLGATELFRFDSDDIVGSHIEVVDPLNADMNIVFGAADTDSLTPGTAYFADVKISPAVGDPYYLFKITISVEQVATD